MARIIFEKVKKCFKNVMVITELVFTINDGEFFTFVGPSGCGNGLSELCPISPYDNP